MDPTITRIRVRDSFPAAHRIRLDDCGTHEPIHVHHWRVAAVFQPRAGDVHTATHQARKVIADWARQHRGRSLNDVPPFDRLSPTAEQVARQLAGMLERRLPDLVLIEVTIGEAAGFSATYRPPG
ncbi:MAG TPA: 6-carboxytetrahydropterin synthase [Acidobacteriota bacterium]|nr:6-carboxytetrahydropterin synthase [Acidobacteriota bacterium]